MSSNARPFNTSDHHILTASGSTKSSIPHTVESSDLDRATERPSFDRRYGQRPPENSVRLRHTPKASTVVQPYQTGSLECVAIVPLLHPSAVRHKTPHASPYSAYDPSCPRLPPWPPPPAHPSPSPPPAPSHSQSPTQTPSAP